ncbi:hypothetical protein NF212_10035 [Parasalinivibrio latis]|uniref:hypothetical protein n=1 Tax=Parasalinivibrio latis TaxID=2952610 RepID=UPI0030E3C329
MIAHFSIPRNLPPVAYALNYQRCLITGNWVMVVTLALLSMCIVATYGYESALSIPTLVAAHIATIFLAGLFKVGYVMRCVALKAFGSKNF